MPPSPLYAKNLARTGNGAAEFFKDSGETPSAKPAGAGSSRDDTAPAVVAAHSRRSRSLAARRAGEAAAYAQSGPRNRAASGRAPS
jgi:hypothetical protein